MIGILRIYYLTVLCVNPDKFLRLALLVIVVLSRPTPGPASGIPLEPGKPIERSIAAGETHTYTITLTTGQYAYVTVEQRGVDVIVSAYGPGDVPIVQVDSPN